MIDPRKSWIALGASLALTLFSTASVYAQTAAAPAPDAATAPASADAADSDEGPLTEDEMEVLVARIALYPDDLVAVVLAASIYPLQVVQASRYLEDVKKNPDLKPSDKWDGSVISLLNYPQVVKMMSDDLDWTQQLGDVVATQQKDVLVAIQQLRDQAVDKGVLKSGDKVVVTQEKDNVVIKSSDPQTIYVPTYPPEMLYEPNYVYPPNPIVYDSYPSYYYPTAPYWAGFITGAAFAAIVDWDNWGSWGGDIDIDIDNINNRFDLDFDKIDVDKLNLDKLKNVDFRNIDRSQLNLKNMNVDRTKLAQNLKARDGNNLAQRAKDRPGAGTKVSTRAHDLKGKDVRKNVADGLKNKPNAKLPKPPTQKANRPAQRDQARKPTGSGKPSVQRVTQKKTGANRPAARPDNRPRQPSAMGNPNRGRTTMNHSNRGSISRGGGGFHGGGGGRGGGGRGGGGRR